MQLLRMALEADRNRPARCFGRRTRAGRFSTINGQEQAKSAAIMRRAFVNKFAYRIALATLS